MCSDSHSGTMTAKERFWKRHPAMPTLMRSAAKVGNVFFERHQVSYNCKLTVLARFPILMLSIIISVQAAPSCPNP